MKKSKKIFILSSLFVVVAILCTWITISTLWVSDVKDQPEKINYQTLDDSKYKFATESVNGVDYAVLIGLTGSPGNPTISGDMWSMEVPSTANVVDNGVTKTLPVKKIDIPVGTMMGSTHYPNWFSGSNPNSFVDVGKIVVPKSVEFISYGAFNLCTNVIEVELPFVGTERGNQSVGANGVNSAFLSIFGDDTFLTMSSYSFTFGTINTTGGNGTIAWYPTVTHQTANLKWLNVPVKLKKVKITDEISVATHAFFQNMLVEEIDISFRTGIVNSPGALSFGDRVFDSCQNLVKVVLPTEISSYGDGIFSQCTSLTTVNLPYGIEAINYATFFKCNALNEIVIPSSVKYIKKDAFTDCSNLQKLYPSNISAADAQEGECRLPEAVEEVAEYAFRNCMAFTKMTVSSKVKSIGYMAFNGCANLTSITLPFIGVKSGNTGTKDSLFGYVFGEYGNGGEDSTDTILNASICTKQEYIDTDGEKNAALFYIPLHLKSVVITNETVVGENAFMNCTMIETLELGSTIKSITKGSLKNCINLKSLTMPFVGPNNSASYANGGHLGYIFGSEYNNSAIEVDVFGTYYYISPALETVTLTNQTTLKQHSFYKVSMVKNLVVGKATQSAERSVFTGNTQLESLTLPFVGIARGNYYYGHYWSYDDYIRNSIMWLFSHITAPGVYENLSISGDWSENTWGSYIPETLTNLTITDESYIHTYAFRGFRSLETITLRDTEAGNQDTITHISSYCMTGCSGLKTLNLPFIGANKNINALNNYSYVLGWIFGNSSYAGSYAAYQAGRTWYIPNNLDSIQFGSAQTSIASDAFRGLKSITAVSSDAIISQLGDYAFANCVRLNKLDLKKANYVKVGNYAFLNDVGLSVISEFTPSTVNQIGHGGFMGTSIQDVDLKKYKFVGDYAFSNCMQLKAIDFTEANLEYVGTHLFAGCKFLADVQLTRYITAYMFKDCVSLRTLDVDVVMNSIHDSKDKIIPDGFVEGCTNLRTANDDKTEGFLLNPLSSGVISIGANAFKGCKSITEMYLPETLLEIKAGAFQNCTKLENLRIPRNVSMMPYGTRNGIDNYTLGIFYGCNDNFYLEVFYPEDEWFDTWGENWNCYFPVYIIGDQIEDIYTYEYSADLKGYLITGLNTDKYDFIYTNATGTSTYLLQNTITFPASHDGIKVYGLANNAFKDQTEFLAKVNNFVLGKNFTYMGEKSLVFGNRWISIYSCSSHTSTIDTLHIGSEDYYAERARVYYQAAWKLVGTTPVWTMDALSFELNVKSKEYTYALGKAIKPEIINIKSNQEIIKFTRDYDQVVADEADEIYNLTHDEYDELDLNILSLQYKNNINVGTGNIIVTPSDSRLTGTHTINFKVIPYEIDLFYDSEKDPNSGMGFADNLQNEIFGMSSGDSYLRKHTYSGNSWSFSAWDQNTALYLPTGYKLVGKLETASANSGYYAVDKYNSPLFLLDSMMEPIVNVGTFKWNGGFKVYNQNGIDVTRNFSCAISLAVQILPYEITEVVWPGTQADGIYEYGYTGQPIIPVPTVKNGPKGLNPQFVIAVTPNEAIYPSDTIYTATIVGYDSHNFILADTCVKVIQFKVVKADVYIEMAVWKYKILETEDYFSFSDFSNWENYKLSYNMNITGLGPNSYIDGFLRTSGWNQGIYRSGDTSGMTVVWGDTGYNIYSTTQDEQGNPIVETNYYNITLNVSVEIVFQDFDYDLTLDTNNDQHLFKDAIGVKTFSADNTHIVYGTDGKDHVIQAFIRNTSSATISFAGTTDSYPFKNTGLYEFTLSIIKDKFNPINININMDVVKGDYEFESLTKEYDRLAVDPISKLKRQPVDFQQEKIKFTYYNFSDIHLSSPLAGAPSSIGKYIVVINTLSGHSVWFNDLENHKINFEITKRSLIIDVVDQVAPYDSKVYDGEAWKLVVNSITGVYNLLDGDMLTGSFISKSASIGTYYGQNAFGGSDFFCNSENGWVVNNTLYGTVTSCYNIVFKGEYTILPREIQFTSSGGTYDYDGSYHSIEVNVQDPASNYQIYYSEKEVSIGPDGVDNGDWSIFPFYYSSPGEYTVYFKVVADTYETKYWSETVTIKGKEIVYALADENAHYDGYPHGITVTVTDPWNAQISYAIVDTNVGSIDFEQLSYTNVCPTFTEIGTYVYVVKITALNYNTVYKTAILTIDNNGSSMNVSVSGWTGTYDALYHGPTFSNNLLSLDGAQVFYANGDSWNADTVWNTFFTVSDSTNLTQPLFIEAGKYDIVVKIMAKGYKVSYTVVTIDIKELTLDLQITGYNGVYNGEGHTGILTNPSGLLVTDDLIINGTTFENLKYTYKMMIGGTETILDLDVYYSSVNNYGNPNSTTWTKAPIKFKDVGNYILYVMVQAENCKTEYLTCQITIIKNQNPEVVLDDFIIQYLGIPLPNSEVPVKAFHDGDRIYVYQTYGGNAGGGLSYISNPIDLGKYKVTITFLETNNCAGVTVSANFEIVPRELIIEYDDELEYTGMVQMPEVTATTGTDDEIIIVRAIIGTEQPIEVNDYEMSISMLYENPNYVIRMEDQILPFKITKRKVYVTLKEEYDYNGTTPWQKNSNWYIYNHLGGDTFEANMETENFVRGLYTLIGTYSYNGSGYEFNDTSSVFSYKVICNTLAMKKADGTDAYYYDIVCDIQISIVYPPLEIEVKDPTIYEYDGNSHSLDIKILSSGTGAITSSFWYVDDPDHTYPYLNVINVGEYKIGYKIAATNFEPIIGEATLIIEQTELDIDIDEFSGIYDGEEHDVTYKILNPGFTMPSAVKPKKYYFNVDILEEKNIKVSDIIKFFKEGCPKTSKVYDVWIYAPQHIIDAGTYQSVVYFAETLNWVASVAVKEVTLNQRPLYFNNIGISPLVLTKNYDGQKYIISLGDFEYDLSGKNNLPNAGLLSNHKIDKNQMTNYSIRTVSPNARGEIGNGDPYQNDGDFEFNSILISQGGSGSANLNFSSNYYPVINEESIGTPALQVIIRRIALTVFDVEDYIHTYNGKDALPKISTPSDGELKYYYFKVDANHNRIDNTLYENQTDVGYYEVYITILEGTNYKAWAGDHVIDSTVNAAAPGYYFKKAYVQVVPKEVNVQWEENEVIYDGEDHFAKPYIMDVFGNKQLLDYNSYDEDGFLRDSAEMHMAGSYGLEAYISGSSILNPNNYVFGDNTGTFTILKRTYLVKERSKEPFLHTAWSKSYTEADFNDPDNGIYWLDGHELNLTISTATVTAGTFQNKGQFKIVQTITDSNGMDVSSCFLFDLDMKIILESRDLVVEAEDIEMIFNNTDVYPNISVTSHNSGYNISYQTVPLDFTTGALPNNFDEDSLTYPDSNPPSFRDVGRYRIYYRALIPAENAPSVGYADVWIQPDTSELHFSDSLSKTYDGIAVQVSSLQKSGKFNGNSDTSLLEYTWYEGHITPTAADTPMGFTPFEVGEYTLLVTCSADNNGNYAQNYAPLEAVFQFEITPAEITLVVNTDWEVNSTILTNGTWALNPGILTNVGSAPSEIYVDKLFGSDALKYEIKATENLERGIYTYTTGVAQTSGFLFSANGKEFSLNWSLHYQGNGTPDRTKNYNLKLVFNLNVHFPYMQVQSTEQTYTYANGVYRSPDIVVNMPATSSDYTIFYGDSSTTCTSYTYNKTYPGIYLAFFEITPKAGVDYEPYKGTNKFTIEYQEREIESVTSIGKEYDSIPVDKPTVTFTSGTLGVEGIPDISTWKIEFYRAARENINSPWYKTGDPFNTAIEVGDYIYKLTIPSGVLFGETVIENYFNIVQRRFYISGTATPISFNGSNWEYDLISNPDGFAITNLLSGDEIKSGVLVTSSMDAGIYSYNSQHGRYINFKEGYRIENSDGKDVTINYGYNIDDVSVEIKKGTMYVTTTIPPSGIYTYITSGVTPSAMCITPSKPDTFEYSMNGSVWKNTPYTYIGIGEFYMYIRATAENYEDFYMTYPFEVQMASDEISLIEEMSREYNGNPIALPKIHTASGYNGVANKNWVAYYDSSGSLMLTTPTNVGTYTAVITYPSTQNYAGTQISVNFEITPAKITLAWSGLNCMYDATSQTPEFNLSSVTYPTWLVKNDLVEGIHYKLTYYSANDLNTPLGVTPINVGVYHIKIQFIGEAAKNYQFTGGTIIEGTNYTIIPADITISIHGTRDYNLGNKITLFKDTDFTVEGLPQGIDFISSIRTNSGSIGLYTAKGIYSSLNSNFSSQFEWGSGAEPVFQFAGTSNLDSLSNYKITLDIEVRITAGVVTYTVESYEGVYDGNPHTFKFEIGEDETDPPTIKYSVDGGITFTETKPYYTNAMNSPVHVIVQVTTKTYGTALYGDDASASDYNQFSIFITKEESEITNANEINLNKVYDGKTIVNPAVTYNGDLRDSYLSYEYFKLKAQSASGATYEKVEVNTIIGVGKYCVKIKLKESQNYQESDEIEIFFEITPRKIVIQYLNQSKVYDGYVWRAIVSNDSSYPSASGAKVLGLTGVSESGLLPGNIFVGIIQTSSANAGLYKLDPAGDFNWYSQYKITDGSEDVTLNYEIILDLEVTISPAEFDVEAKDGGGIYDGITEYFISIIWNTNPFVATSNLNELISYSLIGGTAGPYQSDPIGVKSGSKTIYVKIEAANYKTLYTSALVKVDPINSQITITDFDGKAGDIIYNGNPYDTGSIEITLNVGTDRTPYFVFYQNGSSTPLSGPPTNAGNYYFIVKVDAAADGSASYAESGKCYFKIIPKEIEVEWKFDKVETNSSGQPVYKMTYTGSAILPEAKALAIDNITSIPLKFTFLSPDGVSDAIIVGPYVLKASIMKDLINLYHQNYKLKNDTISFEVIPQKGGGDFIPPDADPDDFPIDPNGPDYAGMTFPTPQGNPKDNGNPYTFGDDLWVTGIMSDTNGNSATYHFRIDGNGEVITILVDSSGNTYPVDPGTFNFKVKFEDQKCPLSSATVILKDKNNTAWDSNGDTEDKKIQFKVNQKPLDPTPHPDNNDPDPDNPIDPDNPLPPIGDIIIRDYVNSHKWTGNPITFELEVVVTNGTNDPSDDTVLVEGVDYEIIWIDNTDPTGDTVDSMASFVVKSLPTGGYSFKLGDETTSSKADDAGRFTILTSEPTRLKLTADAKIQFVNVNQDFDADTISFDVMTFDERNTVLDALQPSEQVKKPIRLGHLYQGTTFASILAQFANDKQYIRIYDMNDVLIYDGSDSTLQDDTQIIATGQKIALVDPSDPTQTLDVIELMLKGDTNGDGYININDVSVIIENLSLSLGNEDKLNTLYQAGLLTGLSVMQNINDVAMIISSISGSTDINADYKP